MNPVFIGLASELEKELPELSIEELLLIAEKQEQEEKEKDNVDTPKLN